MVAAKASTSAMDNIGRFGERPCAAPFTTQGFRLMSSSATALVSMALSSR
jgi:hypothetical protein